MPACLGHWRTDKPFVVGGGGGFLCCILLSVILAAHLPYNRLYAPVVRRTASIMQGFPYRAES